MYNTTIRALQQFGLADPYGESRIPLYVLNVTYPLVPEEITRFCSSKRAVLVVEEGQPAHLEEAINSILRRADINDPHVIGKDVLPVAGEYTGEVVLNGIAAFLEADFARRRRPQGRRGGARWRGAGEDARRRAARRAGADAPARLLHRLPGAAGVHRAQAHREGLGGIHISSDIGCHTFSTLQPFNLGNTVLGYGLSLAAASAMGPNFGKRIITVMGDGGFWHQGLTTGVANAVFRNDDGVLVIMQNGYTSATGTQNIPSSPDLSAQGRQPISIESTLRGLGVKWLERVPNYQVSDVADALRRAMTTERRASRSSSPTASACSSARAASGQ
jgi:indolepyruvate ferredoxin oxidoreductase alpha subunit